MNVLFVLAESLPALDIRILDLVVLIALAMGAYNGFQKGFLVELLSTILFFAVIILGFKGLVMAFNSNFVKSGWGSFLTFMTVLFLVSIGIKFLGGQLKKMISFTPLDKFDDAAGAILGLFKYSLFISVGLLLLTEARILNPAEMQQTLLYPPLQSFLKTVLDSFGHLDNGFPELYNKIKDMI